MSETLVHPSRDSRLVNMADRVGSFIEYWGFKQVHGKVWTLVFLAPAPVDANYLRKTLGISKALTSMTIKDLLHYRVILEVEKERPGTQKYAPNPDIMGVILDVLRQREIQMLTELQTSFASLQGAHAKKPMEQVQSQRLGELGFMIDAAKTVLQSMTQSEKVDFKVFEQALSLQQKFQNP